jgi:4-hydroxy-3-polyprenylbenzoate decarboxylase
MRVIVGITGATGIVYAIRLLEVLKEHKVEIHLVMSEWALQTVALETGYSAQYVAGLASYCYDVNNMGAKIASGSFLADAMAIVPCSMKSLAAIAHGFSDNLLLRAADVAMKEKRKLILVPRETPLSPIHLQNMLALSRLGVVIMPPMPSFYHKPRSIGDMVDQFAGRVLDQLRIDNGYVNRWLD